MNRLKQLLMIVGIMGILMLSSCSSNEDPFDNGLPKYQFELNDCQTKSLATSNDFGLKVLEKLNASGEENIIYSPLSLSMTLGMLANGADDQLLTDLFTVLYGENSSGDELEEINNLNKLLMENLNKIDSKTKVYLANSLWYRDNITLNRDFSSSLANYFKAEICKLSKDPSKNRKEINKWCKDKTSGLISEFIKSDDEVKDLAVGIYNAIYFQSKWKTPFNRNLTHKALFHNISGTSSEIDMMHNDDYYGIYAEDEFFQMVKLDYHNGGYCMRIWLPNQDIDFRDAISMLTPERMADFYENAKYHDVDLSLPKFKFSYEVSFKSILDSFGLGRVFDGSDSGLLNVADGFFIHGLKQSAIIDVNEEETKAAAVTGADGDGINLIDPAQKVIMNINRPFIFFIQEYSSNATILSGVVKKL